MLNPTVIAMLKETARIEREKNAIAHLDFPTPILG